MAEKPKHVLPEQRLAAAFGKKKAGARHPIKKQHGQGRSQNRQCEEQQNRRDEERPDGQRQAKIRHAGRPHVDDRGDVVDRAHQGRDTENEQADNPEILSPFDPGILRPRGERRITRPTASRGTTGNEETREHNHRSQRAHPEREHIQFRECHVACTDHQWNEKIPESSNHDRHHDEENHDSGMHGKQSVVSLRRDNSVIHVRLGNELEPRHRGFGPSQLPAHEHGEQAADDDHEEPHEQELAADHLMVQGENIFLYETEFLVVSVRDMRRHCHCIAHYSKSSVNSFG